MKKCNKCNKRKLLASFYSDSSKKDKISTICKDCQNLNSKNWRTLHPDWTRNWRIKNPERNLYNQAHKRAINLQLPFSISLTDIKIPKYCPILGIELNYKQRDAFPSLDRVNPKLGYIPGNVAIISFRANQIKNNGTIEEHLKIAAWMKKHENHST